MTQNTMGKKVAEMQAEHQVFLDAQQTTTRCALQGCKWKFVGGAAEGRLQAEKHRQEDHPERARGGDLEKAFAARRGRRKPWTDAEILEAFQRFHVEYGRGAVPNDIPLCPYLPSMNTVVKAFGSWTTARERSEGRASAPVAAPAPKATASPPDPARAPQRRGGGDPAPVPQDASTRLRLAVHELVDAVFELVAA